MREDMFNCNGYSYGNKLVFELHLKTGHLHGTLKQSNAIWERTGYTRRWFHQLHRIIGLDARGSKVAGELVTGLVLNGAEVLE
jgi:hypothetical protein